MHMLYLTSSSFLFYYIIIYINSKLVKKMKLLILIPNYIYVFLLKQQQKALYCGTEEQLFSINHKQYSWDHVWIYYSSSWEGSMADLAPNGYMKKQTDCRTLSFEQNIMIKVTKLRLTCLSMFSDHQCFSSGVREWMWTVARLAR